MHRTCYTETNGSSFDHFGKMWVWIAARSPTGPEISSMYRAHTLGSYSDGTHALKGTGTILVKKSRNPFLMSSLSLPCHIRPSGPKTFVCCETSIDLMFPSVEAGLLRLCVASPHGVMSRCINGKKYILRLM